MRRWEGERPLPGDADAQREAGPFRLPQHAARVPQRLCRKPQPQILQPLSLQKPERLENPMVLDSEGRKLRRAKDWKLVRFPSRKGSDGQEAGLLQRWGRRTLPLALASLRPIPTARACVTRQRHPRLSSRGLDSHFVRLHEGPQKMLGSASERSELLQCCLEYGGSRSSPLHRH